MKLSGTIAPALSGQVSGFDLFDVSQLLCLSGRSRALRVVFGDQTGTLIFDRGNLVHASAPAVSGEEAFFTMAAWAGGSFESIEEGEAGTCPENIHVPTMHLLMEAARRKDEISARPGTATGESPVSEDSDEDALWQELASIQQEVAERLAREHPAEVLPPAPDPLPHSESGREEATPGETPEGIADSPPPAPPGDWWQRVKGRWGDAVQVVVAWPEDVAWEEAGSEVTHLAAAAGAKAPSVLLSSKGPSFVRIYPEAGGILSLVFLGISKRHRFLFETLARSAHAALVPAGLADREADQWIASLPKGFDWRPVQPGADRRWGFAERISELAGDGR